MNDTTIALAFDYDVLTDGVLPDLEDPRDLIVEAPVQQVPTDEPDASWGFVKRGRRFPASKSLSNLAWAVALYAPRYGLAPERTKQFIALLEDVSAALGESASPDEVYVAMRQLLVGTNDLDAPRAEVMHDAWHDLWDYQAQGGVIFDPEA